MISQFISAFLILRALLTGKEKYCLRLSEIRFDKRKAVGILQIGIPSAFQYSLFAFANLFVQSSVNSFDHVLVEGNSAAANADPLVYDMMAAFIQPVPVLLPKILVHGKETYSANLFDMFVLLFYYKLSTWCRHLSCKISVSLSVYK